MYVERTCVSDRRVLVGQEARTRLRDGEPQAQAAEGPGAAADNTSRVDDGRCGPRDSHANTIHFAVVRHRKPQPGLPVSRSSTATNSALLERRGVGPDSAAVLLITAGDNADRLTSEGSFAVLCGVSPVEASSGKRRADGV
jgi:hypothetical protein